LPEIPKNPPGTGEAEQTFLCSLRRSQPCSHLDLGLLVSGLRKSECLLQELLTVVTATEADALLTTPFPQPPTPGCLQPVFRLWPFLGYAFQRTYLGGNSYSRAGFPAGERMSSEELQRDQTNEQVTPVPRRAVLIGPSLGAGYFLPV
jgi:hypothetical protein